jgi:hypothetical protein
MSKYVLELARGETGVGRHCDRACLVGRGVCNDPLQRLFGWQVDGDPVALRHTCVHQSGRDPIGFAVPICEGDGPPACHIDVAGLAGEVFGHQPELVREQMRA